MVGAEYFLNNSQFNQLYHANSLFPILKLQILKKLFRKLQKKLFKGI